MWCFEGSTARPIELCKMESMGIDSGENINTKVTKGGRQEKVKICVRMSKSVT